MPTPIVIGTETEFGIAVQGAVEFNPVLASSLLINSYTGGDVTPIQWDFESESPGLDARGYGFDGVYAPEIETGLVNCVLTNGARYYVDHAHPEYSTPETIDPRDTVLFEKAGERILEASMRTAQPHLGDGQAILIHKNNSDGKGNSYGSHENYLLSREVPFSLIVRALTPFFVSRQVFTGSGKVGAENGREPVDYQITQRADFFEEEVGLETTLKRPIVNTRDEPHADPQKYRRLHVIIGDANMSEVQTFLKVGATAIVVRMIEERALPLPEVELADPVASCWRVSHDITCRETVRLANGKRATPLEVQWAYYDAARKFTAEGGDAGASGEDVLAEWERVLTALETDPMTLGDTLDWVAKLALIEAYRARDDLAWTSPKCRLLALQYHDVRRGRGLYERLVASGRMRTLLDDTEVERAMTEPPETTRAYFRGRAMARFADSVVAANWDSLVFDTGRDTLQRVPMAEPLRGTRQHVGALLDEVESAAELVARLSA